MKALPATLIRISCLLFLLIALWACRDFEPDQPDPCRRTVSIGLKCISNEVRCKDYQHANGTEFYAGDSLFILLEGSNLCEKESELFTQLQLEIQDTIFIYYLNQDESQTFSKTLSLHYPQAGSFSTTLTAFRNNGTIVASRELSFRIINPDLAGPQIIWHSPADQVVIQTDSLLLDFVIRDSSKIQYYSINQSGPSLLYGLDTPGSSSATQDSVQFVRTISLKNASYGQYQISVEATDSRGNTRTSSLHFEYKEAPSWQPLSSPPSSFWQAMAFAIGDKGYFVGGMDFSGSTSLGDESWEYNPQTDVWTQKASFPGGPRRVGFAFSLNGYAYVGGGHSIQPPIVYQSDFWRYDPDLDQWTQMADLPSTRIHSVAFALNDKGYMGTGYSASYVPTDDFWEYDPVLDQWNQKADFPGGIRTFASGLAMEDYGYVGLGAGSPPSQRFQDWWRYDPLADAWSARQDFPSGTETLAIAFELENRAYVGLGSYHPKSIFEYNPQTDNWIQKPDFPNRGLARGFAIEDTAWIIGSDDFETNFFYKYVPSLDP